MSTAAEERGGSVEHLGPDGRVETVAVDGSNCSPAAAARSASAAVRYQPADADRRAVAGPLEAQPEDAGPVAEQAR